jgi:transcriptional regulator with XRE-family HTH domain
MEIRHKLGHQIRKAREAIGWSQAELGERCQVKRAQISKLEQDITKASMVVFLRISEALRFEILLREQPQTAITPNAGEKLDFEEILGKLPPAKREELEKRARRELAGETSPFFIITPVLHAKMVGLLEVRSEQEEQKRQEAQEDEED